MEESKNAFTEIGSDPNFFMILAGAVIWFIGFYVGFLNPLFLSTGFVLVCFYATLTSLKRPVILAWPGILLGGLLQIIGYYLGFVLLLNLLSPAFIVTGGVIIIYFATPLALQRGELPVIKQLQKLIESKKKEEVIEDIKTEGPSKEGNEVSESEPSINND